MAGKRALFVGINKFAKYPQFTLHGCVNDAKDMSALYKELYGFKASDTTVLTDAAATKSAIMSALKKMVTDAKKGSLTHLVFSLSSHGTQMNDTSGDEPDGMDEAFVPHDIDQVGQRWDPKHIISDDELHDLFVQLPDTVLLEVFLDTCHSGTGLRGAEFGLHAPRPRFIEPPSHEFGNRTAKMRGFTLRRAPASRTRDEATRKGVTGASHILWTGCKAKETSADAYFDGRYNGAFTYHFIKVMRDSKGKEPRKSVITRMRNLMTKSFAQQPQLEANASNRSSAIAY